MDFYDHKMTRQLIASVLTLRLRTREYNHNKIQLSVRRTA